MIRFMFQKGPVSSSAGMLDGPGELEAGRPTEMLVEELSQEIKGPGPRWDRTLVYKVHPRPHLIKPRMDRGNKSFPLPAYGASHRGAAPTM